MSDAAVDTSSEITTKVRLDASRPFEVRAPPPPERRLAGGGWAAPSRYWSLPREPARPWPGLLGSPLFVCAGEGAGSAAGRREARRGLGRAPSGTWGAGAKLEGLRERLLHDSRNLFVTRLSGGGRRGAGWGSSARTAHENNFETRARLESEVLWGGGACAAAARLREGGSAASASRLRCSLFGVGSLALGPRTFVCAKVC